MKGLYILSSSLLKSIKTLKIGMSEKLENRWSNYKCFIPDAHYLYCYEILNNLTKKDILYLESLILNETIKSRNIDLATEYRSINCETLHKIIIKYLEYYNVTYIIHENPKFKIDKSKKDIFEDIYPDINFEDILAKPPKRFIKIKNDKDNTKNMLENQQFTNIQFITDNCILANKNDNLYIFKQRNASKLQTTSYNIFTYENNISTHYNKIKNLIKDINCYKIKYCYLLVFNSDNYIYYLVELTDIDPKYTIENIENKICDEMITIKSQDIEKYKI